jgi:hypothetical protein
MRDIKREATVNRELIIQKLIESQVDYITRHGCSLWLHNVLERGFKGFSNMTDEQLLLEMRQRGLRYEFENRPWPVDEEDDDEPEPEDEEIRQMLGECVTADTRAS